MPIDRTKLKHAVTTVKGDMTVTIAQCPACRAAGSDTTGNHLIVYPDGRFGCVVYPGDNEHRKEIFSLVGVNTPYGFVPRRKTRPKPTSRFKTQIVYLKHSEPSRSKDEKEIL